MKSLASIMMALFLGTTALVALPSDSQALPGREDSYGTRDYNYREGRRWDNRYYPRDYYRGDRKYSRYDRYRPGYRDRYDRYDRYNRYYQYPYRDYRYPGYYR